MTELAKSYDPAEVESGLYEAWEAAGLFEARHDAPGEPFAIVFPPPNVTGALHIGHALTHAVQDAMIRHAKMNGKNTVYVPGTDHAGIATQNVVEKQLAAEGRTRHDLGREAFIERVWEWKKQSGGTILEQLRKLGTGADWSREAFTFDDERSVAVRKVFVDLYEQELIYRGYRLINWCPRCMTALSEIEVDHLEIDGELVLFRYPFSDDSDNPGRLGGDGIEVATTRVETMLGDTAIAVHPEDPRYADAIGRTVRHPFLDREFAVIADDYVDPEFGTGAVKITPAHDPNDYDIGQRHDLASIDLMTDDATMNENAGPYAGMDRFDARTKIKADLDALGLLVGVKKHPHPVGHCSRCKTIVEPRLSDQWFVQIRPLADKAAAAVRNGDVQLLPERNTKPFLDWLDNHYDWCISRQIWWGHRIPAWYCIDGHVTVSIEDVTACGTCGSTEVRQDDDVLDTWFSSALWPFTVFGWPEKTADLATWYPTAVLETGYDINTFWVSKMLMMGCWLLDEVPFRTVWNHGMVRDQNGKKMSKSFGNVIDPLDFIATYGADALRFALFQHCSPGVDVPLAEEWVEGARRFGNKLWNATRFALGNLDGVRPGRTPPAADLALEDRWILSRLAETKAKVDAAYVTWEWSRIADAIYNFAWNELADWYLEAVKVRVYGEDEAAAATAKQVLANVLDELFVLLHPLMPFISDRLATALTGDEGSLLQRTWPTTDASRDEAAEAEFAVLQDLVTEVRRFRSQNSVAPSKRIAATVVSPQRAALEPQQALIGSLAGIGELSFADEAAQDAGTSRVVCLAGEVHVPLAGLIDVDGEIARVQKELERIEGERKRVGGKLSNEGFVAKAPAAVVDAERAKLVEFERVTNELTDQLAQLHAMQG